MKLLLHFQLTNLDLGHPGDLVNSKTRSGLTRASAVRTAPTVSKGQSYPHCPTLLWCSKAQSCLRPHHMAPRSAGGAGQLPGQRAPCLLVARPASLHRFLSGTPPWDQKAWLTRCRRRQFAVPHTFFTGDNADKNPGL